MDSRPTPGIGDNSSKVVDWASEETARLNYEYAYLGTTTEELLAESEPILEVNADNKPAVVTLIKRQRDHAKALVGIHEIEKAPHYRRGQATDQFFFGQADKMSRRDKKAREGEADRLNRLLTEYDVRVRAEEEAKARLIWEEQERQRIAAEEAALKAQREAEEARLKAERARTAATQAAKQEAAQAAEQAAAAARVEQAVAEKKAEDAYAVTLRPASEIMRTRMGDGTLATMGEEKFVEIIDRSKIDFMKLGPYFTLAAIQAASNGYATANGHSNDASVQIAGIRFGKRPKSRVR